MTCIPEASEASEAGPVELADCRRRATAGSGLRRQDELEQFFSPPSAARRLAAMLSVPSQRRRCRVLVPGAGTGMLAAAAVERAAVERWPDGLDVVCVELDKRLTGPLRATLDDCSLRADVRADVVHGDFLAWALAASTPTLPGSDTSDSERTWSGPGPPIRPGDLFDVVIANPPFAKLSRSGRTARTLREAGMQVSNLYAAFVWTAARLLRPGGQLAAVTPTSFLNGGYFGDYRRAVFAGEVCSVTDFATFESRTGLFPDDNVLQECVMFRTVRGDGLSATVSVAHEAAAAGRPDTDGAAAESAAGSAATAAVSEYRCPTDVVVGKPGSSGPLRVPRTPQAARLTETMNRLPCTVSALGVTVSAGAVVEHRRRSMLRRSASSQTHAEPAETSSRPTAVQAVPQAAAQAMPGFGPSASDRARNGTAVAASDAVPLLAPEHLRGGRVRWPNHQSPRPDLLAAGGSPDGLTLPSGTYILCRRISFPEAQRRVAAAVLETADLPGDQFAATLAMNVFHHAKTGLDGLLAWGLAVWLLSRPVDQWIRQTAGTNHLNSADLETLPCPARSTLELFGVTATSTASLNLGHQDADSIINDTGTGIVEEIAHAAEQAEAASRSAATAA